MAREINNREYIIDSSCGLGIISKNLGEYARAEEYYCQAVALAREIHASSLLCHALLGLAEVYLCSHCEDKAGGLMREILILAQELQVPELTSSAQKLSSKLEELRSRSTQGPA